MSHNHPSLNRTQTPKHSGERRAVIVPFRFVFFLFYEWIRELSCLSHRIYINKYFQHPAHSTAQPDKRQFCLYSTILHLICFSRYLVLSRATVYMYEAMLLSYAYARGTVQRHTRSWKPHIHSNHYTLACTATFTYNIICFGRI